MQRRVGVALAGVLLASVAATGSSAYFAEEPGFAVRGGGAAALTRQLDLGPVELAIQSTLGALSPANANLEYDAAGVLAFYEERGFQPVWIGPSGLTDTAALAARIAGAAAEGLDPRAYHLPALNAAPNTPEEIALAEIQFSLAVAAYAREAYAGRLDPRSIDPNLDIRPHLPDIAEALTLVAIADDPSAALAGYNPTHAGYVALRDELARIQSETPVARIIVPTGPTIRPGDVDERVALIRARLEINDTVVNPAVYDDAVVSAVRAFQTQAGLNVDGVIGPNTLGALNGPNVDPAAELIANMERWRWLPRDLGDYYVQVNVPEFVVRIFDNGEKFYETRVVVGTLDNQTPIFSDQIEHFIVNPFWHVPPSIAAEELLPQIRNDPGYFVRNNFDVFYNANGRSTIVDPFRVNWWAVQPGQVSFRQRPGAANALGQIKFMFPNSHNVYLHDTPSKSLFQRDVRSFSHGCIRVMNPMDFADALLSREPNLDGDDLIALFGDTERQVDLTRAIPVHITYFTAVFEDGVLRFRPDIYGHSAAVREALGLGDGTGAAAPVVTAAGDVGP